jgi:hypothetical protein
LPALSSERETLGTNADFRRVVSLAAGKMLSAVNSDIRFRDTFHYEGGNVDTFHYGDGKGRSEIKGGTPAGIRNFYLRDVDSRSLAQLSG